jgi:hypothetical protein
MRIAHFASVVPLLLFSFASSAEITTAPQSLAKMEKSIGALKTFQELGYDDAVDKAVAELKSLPLSERKKLINEFATRMSKDFRSFTNGMEREKTYHQFLKIADHLVPEAKICSYFYNCYEKNIIDLNGLNKLVDHFDKKEGYKGKVKPTEAIDISELEKRVKSMEDSSFIGNQTFLVRPAGKHITPVFFRRDKDKTEVIIMDSLGEEAMGYKHASAIEEKIRSASDHHRPLNVSKALEKRQNDGASCPIFSFRDVLENTKVDMFQYVKNSLSGESTCSKNTNIVSPDGMCIDSFLINTLPPNFIKVAQIPRTINKYLDSTEKVSPPSKSVSQNNSEERTLKELKDEYGTTNYTRKRAYKYYQILIENLLQESTANP